MLRILHFADAHIDIANYGRHDPASGLPLRVLDFLKALDTIVDTAIAEKVDLVLFAGDAYKDRTPAPTFQREWGKRIIRLSRAGIPTLLLVGNHDLSPAAGRAHALQEYQTLQVDNVHVVDRPRLLLPADLNNLPLQIMAIPWVSRSTLMALLQLSGAAIEKLHEEIENRLNSIISAWFEQINEHLPVVLTAHGSVQGAVYGGERSVMLGNDLVLPGSLVRNPRLDYVALGHIHKSQNLNPKGHPPVVYSGSIERVDFGEARDDKFFVIAAVERGKTVLDWRKLDGRRFLDCQVNLGSAHKDTLPEPGAVLAKILAALPNADQMKDAIIRLVIDYPRDWERLIDEAALRRYAENCFDFHLVRRPLIEGRIRLGESETIASASPLELLDIYWKTLKTNPQDAEQLNRLAAEIITSAETHPIDSAAES
ncbi:MAG: exonuclease subunit SbcD [Bellilinea sp.]|jgi:exonuclease SbcD